MSYADYQESSKAVFLLGNCWKIYVFLLGSYSLLLFNANMTCSAIILVCTWLWLILTHAVRVLFLHLSDWSYWSLDISYFKSQREGIWLTHAISSFLQSRLCQMLLASLWFGCPWVRCSLGLVRVFHNIQVTQVRPSSSSSEQGHFLYKGIPVRRKGLSIWI